MTIKGFSIPGDTGKFIWAFFYMLRWNNKIKKSGFNNIVRTLENNKITKPCDAADYETLVKYHRILGFLLVRLMHHKNPCTVKALALFDICNKKNIQCRLVVGADKKDNAIAGHSWVEVNGNPINESKEALGKFTRVIEV